MKNLFNNDKGLVLKRFVMLVPMAGIGLLFVYGVVQHSDFLLKLLGMNKTDDEAERFLSSLYVIVLGLPTLAMLWFFRTNDTIEQIKKTKESTETNILFDAQEMLRAESGAKNVVGFALLMDLHQRGLHQSTIDLATRNVRLAKFELTSMTLRGVNLQHANMTAANLSNSDLTETNLRHAKLQNANLQNACLRHVNLEFAKLEKADMRNANLQGANLAQARLVGARLSKSDLRGADLRGIITFEEWSEVASLCLTVMFDSAWYSADTKFPAGFVPEQYGMKKYPSNKFRAFLKTLYSALRFKSTG
ncbi:MAG: pentapeptide repeat-containing protein [Gammaproteobacteria bacterium]